MKTYDLYGYKYDDIISARNLIEKIIGIRLEEHESSYRCGLYFRYGDIGTEHFILQRNFDPLENEWTDSEHQSYPLLLYVNETTRSKELEKVLTSIEGIVLLKHEEL